MASQDAQHNEDQRYHAARIANSLTPPTRMRFSAHTGGHRRTRPPSPGPAGVLAQAHQHLHQTLLSMVLAIGAISFARSLRSKRLSRMIARWMGNSLVLSVQVSILILLAAVSLANELGMEMVVGAYTAGMMIAMLTKVEILRYRLTSIGSGFFIPLFFITSGIEFDLHALVTSPASLERLILFCAGFLFIRVFPVLLYKRACSSQGEESAQAGEHRPLVSRPALPMVPVNPGRPHHHPSGDVGALA